ncbi:MAG: hypothetical protein KDE51_05330, partial [Anaerolineales bacterium]|nr:hypothetical protein [Anaerolineales bacterium]
VVLASVLLLLPGRENTAGQLVSNSSLPPNDINFSVSAQEDGEGGDEGGEEVPSEERGVVALVEVVVAAIDIPAGERIRAELLTTESRPSDNVAIRAGVTYGEPDLLIGQIAKTDIDEGQAILRPMIALSSTDLPNIGSDLSLFVDRQRVAVAFPISRYSGVSYAMRPGDFVDVMMSFNMVELDLEFQTALPNLLELVDEAALESGQPFLFPATTRGRLEVIPELNNTIVQITPQQTFQTEEVATTDGEAQQATGDVAMITETQQRPRRVTQLTVQQAEVLWVGTWDDPYLGVPVPIESTINLFDEGDGSIVDDGGLLSGDEEDSTSTQPPISDPTIFDQYRSSIQPDVVILSMPVQDALVLKWALEEPGTDIDLVLRSQGDNALYFTTSVSLPQLVEQAGLSIPEPSQFDLQPRIDGSSIPRLPAVNPERNVSDPNEEETTQ